MSTISVIGKLACALVGLAVVLPAAGVAQEGPSRSAAEIRRSVNSLLAAESAAATAGARAAAIRGMVGLSMEIAEHPSLGKETAATLRERLAGRLRRAARELAAGTKSPTAAKSSGANHRGEVDEQGTVAKVATVKPRSGDELVAQQLGGGFGGFAFAAAEQADGGEALADVIQETVAPESWERNGGLGVIKLFGGGAHGGGARGAGGGDGLLAQVAAQGNNAGRIGGPAALALPADASAELIDLIQQVVAPHTWDVNGGAGAAIFFAPKHALVIRQTGEVHDALVDVVGQLRRGR